MSKRTMYFSLILVFMLLVFGAWMLAFFGVTVPTGRIAVNSGPGETKPALSASGVFFNPPSPEEAPESIRAEVILGYKIMTETSKYAGEYVNSRLSCSSCHFDGGRARDSISLVGTGASYPLYRGRRDFSSDLGLRVQECFERSMNGKAPPLDSEVMQSVLVYMQWLSKGIPVYSKLPWKLPRALDSSHKPDAANGSKVFKEVCARCHGQDGNGTPIAPPLWGQGSYNDGAGMHGINMFSVFTWRFMPKSAPSLTPEQALDVAGFVHEQPRPKFVATHPDKIKQNIPLEKGK